MKCKGEMKCFLHLADGLSLHALMYLSSSCLYVSEKREGSVTIDSQLQCPGVSSIGQDGGAQGSHMENAES